MAPPVMASARRVPKALGVEADQDIGRGRQFQGRAEPVEQQRRSHEQGQLDHLVIDEACTQGSLRTRTHRPGADECVAPPDDSLIIRVGEHGGGVELAPVTL